MANVAVDNASLTEIAYAIRMKNGTSTQYKPRDMAGAIDNLPTMQVPPIGFVPATWDAEGYVTSGTWYGDIIPDSYFNIANAYMNIENLIIPNTLTHIGNYSLYGIYLMVWNDLPETLISIGDNAFSARSQLNFTRLPSGLTYLGRGAFQGNLSLALTSLPEGLTEINGVTFSGCKNLALTSLPNSITSIGDSAFRQCVSLALTSLPASLINIGWSAFSKCISISPTLRFPKNIKTIQDNAFEGTKLSSVTFEGTPTSISAYAFKSCTSLTTINVPWAEGEVAGAPWGATNATINYNYTGV